MATSKEFHDYIVENLQKAGKVTTRKMSLLLKPTETVLRLMPDAKRAYPYEGSRTLMVAVEDVENTELMTKVLNGMYKELPKPKGNKMIGIIEDDRLLNQALKLTLEKAGYETMTAHTKKEALSMLGKGEELLLVDIGLPDGDGISLYQELRGRQKTPAIFLTARDEERDMLSAFDIGADDYVVKPFSMKVLLKRIEAVLKRNGEASPLTFRELSLYPAKKQVFMKGQEIRLTAKEYQLLEYLMRNQGQVLTKENILERIWGISGQFVVDNTVSVTVGRLRKKIEPNARQPDYIKNVFGLGYRIGD